MQAATRTSRFSWRFALVVGIAALALGNAARTRARRRFGRPALIHATDRIANALFGDEASAPASASPRVPSLTDVSATTQTARLFTVTGKDFTPGGRVYLAIYDQMGAQLYETRWITASLPLLALTGPTGHEAHPSPGLVAAARCARHSPTSAGRRR